ncbi:uncharacterized protein LOC131976158 [Centropristis striata]|uniref:uncharacterized protein LOC131976158 n=1 Tax=Centropristis striata TaxID=184440 RepID=UPI0027E13F69|nr:uncharacterized protein LOC131976158 [Centropristis striata]
MFLLMWATLLFSVKGTTNGQNIILSATSTNRVQSGFKGRVSLLEPDLNQKNCSIIINDLTESDSGSYQFRVSGLDNQNERKYIYSPKATVSVKALTQKPTVMVPPLTEGQQTTLTCTAPGLCSGSVPTITWTWRGAGEDDSHISGNITAFKTENLTAVSSTLTFNPSAEHHGSIITCKVGFTNGITTEETMTLNVTYVKKPEITGNTTVEEGGALNLTCSGKSFPPSVITWTKHGSNKSLQNKNVTTKQNDTGAANLVILNVTEEYSGLYICTAKHQNTTLTARAEVTLTFVPRVLKSSGCVSQLEVLTCVCISEGSPLPAVEWPLLLTHAEYSVTTNVLKHTVNSSVTVKHRNYTTVDCVSSSKVGTVNMSLNVTVKESEQDGESKYLLIIVSLWHVIVAFVVGILLSATTCCLCRSCQRNKKSSEDMTETETLEMVTIQAVPLISVSQAVEYAESQEQEAAAGGAEAAGIPREVEYSNLDFSQLKRKDFTGAEDTQETTETEYAEIKNKETEERGDYGGEDGEILEVDEEKIGEDEEIKQCTSAGEEGGEDVVVYSNVKEIMEERRTLVLWSKRDERECLNNHRIRMFVLMWATLLFAVGSNTANSEITAEAGLCAVMPCSFTTDPGFTLESAVVYKCEPSKQSCKDIFLHLNSTDLHDQSGSRGRLSLNLKNCSIIISDLTESDSGLYQLRLNGTLKGQTTGYPSANATITVQGLTQKPTVMVPPLTEGQQTTLTCTAPGLCSGSVPTITWTWRGAGEDDSHISGNITAFKTENLTAVTQRHSSTLTFNPSAEHHGSNITCKVGFTNGITTAETVTLNVNYVKEVKITGDTSVKEGETLNLTCSVESFPPSSITWTELGLNETLNNDTGTATLVISNMTTDDRRYLCTVEHLNKSLMQEVNVTVMYVKGPKITGKTTVKEGDALNLTCNAESFPPSLVTWTKIPPSKNLNSGADTDLPSNNGSSSLIIYNVTAEHSGLYVCTAKHLDTTLTTSASVTVTLPPTILKSSHCKHQSEVLSCECLSQGVPLPTVTWTPLENQTEYVLIITASNHTVNSTFTLTHTAHSNTVVECVSSNRNGEVKEKLIIKKVPVVEEEDHHMKMFKLVTRLEIILAFLIGALLSAIICCLVRKCPRKNERIYGNLAETLEMVTSHDDSLMHAGQAVGDYQSIDQVAAEARGEVAVGKPDVEYSKIDFSRVTRKATTEAGTTKESTETEYADVKELKKMEEESRDRDEEGEEEMSGEDTEPNHCVSEEQKGEDEALYSTVKDIMDE